MEIVWSLTSHPLKGERFTVKDVNFIDQLCGTVWEGSSSYTSTCDLAD